MKIYRIAGLITAAAMLSSAAGCGSGGEKYQVTFRNLTGAEISEICIYPNDGEISSENVLEENLAADTETEITIGSFTEEETQSGFTLVVTNAEDGSTGDFSMLMFDSGDTITFYIDDWGLAVGVNMTDEEVEEQIAWESEQFKDYLEELEAEQAAEESAESTSEEERASSETAE